QSTQRKREALPKKSSTGFCQRLQFVVQKNFIRNQRKLMMAAESSQLLQLRRMHKRSGGIVRVHDKHCASALRNGFGNSTEIQVPSMIVKKIIRMELHVLDVSQKIKQRIAGPRY